METLRTMEKLIAIWRVLQKPPAGWRCSVIRLAYFAALAEFGGCSLGEKNLFFSEPPTEEKEFYIFFKKALRQLPSSIKTEIDKILRPKQI